MWRKLCLCGSGAGRSYKLGTSFVHTPRGAMSLQFRQEDEGSLLEVVGGIENDKLPIVKLPPSVRKSKLRTGDIVLSVNGISVAGCSAADVTALIRSCGNELYLEILPSKHGHASSVEFFLNRQGKVHKELYQQIRKCILDNMVKYLVPCTTREMREGERDGEQHFFISLKEFKELLTKKAFLEYSMHGQHYYGTLRFSELQILAAARRVKVAAIEATTPEPADVSAAFSATLVGSVNQSMEQSIITITETDLSTSSPNKSSAQDVIVDSNVTPQHIVLRREENPTMTPVAAHDAGAQATTATASTAKGLSSASSSATTTSGSNTAVKPVATSGSYLQRILARVARPAKGGFGFVVGGDGIQNVRVLSIHPESCVFGLFQPDDIIASIDNQDLSNMTHAQVIDFILQLPIAKEIDFLLLRSKNKPAGPWDEGDEDMVFEPQTEICLELQPGSSSFGLTLLHDEERVCNCVGDLAPNGVASSSGLIKLGDYIVAVNQVDARGKSHDEVVSLIAASRPSVKLAIERPIKSASVKAKIEARQTQIRLLAAAEHYEEKMKNTEGQLASLEDDLKGHMASWADLRRQVDTLIGSELASLPSTHHRVQQLEAVIKNLEARVVQEGVRAELLEEEFHALSQHVNHLRLLSTQVAASGVRPVAIEELQHLHDLVLDLQTLQDNRKRLVAELMEIELANAAAKSQLAATEAVLLTITLDKGTDTSFGFTIIGSGNNPYLDTIVPGSAAARADVRRGDVIVAINGRDVQDGTHEEIVQMMVRSGNILTLTLVRPATNADRKPMIEFAAPPVFVPRVNFTTGELPAMASECFEVIIYTQLERRYISDLQQTLKITPRDPLIAALPELEHEKWAPLDKLGQEELATSSPTTS